ncbi:GNAT family N-acetyltransferase [Paenibacillus sp. D2_2]|uniref:GNAT family N-acetyltransferase n=1 Tax=Paenibacillus sp. D2_2 TaxID=3073092 RepID=UPI002815CECC|nr:GNAT family N-acetyltransferase [Paenibacillus sp. D2_2]WMT39588.1 GNAT family N-acetyltransferase [Paenibacillus sp. D2_2]
MNRTQPLTENQGILIERSEIDYMVDRMWAIKERPGNPEGVDMKSFGNAVAFYSRTMPWPTFNTVKGLSSDDIDSIDAILDFYKSRERKPQFEIVPSRVNSEMLRKLAERGFYQSGFHMSMYYSMEQLPPDWRDTGIDIKGISKEEFMMYALIHCRSTGLPDDGIPYVAENNQVLHGRPGWRFFMAMIDRNPAAVGVMYMNHTVASLTFAGTLPAYRNRGCHQALIRRRIYEAAKNGCNTVVSQAGYLTQSHRNMEQVGMKIGYIRTTWTELER